MSVSRRYIDKRWELDADRHRGVCVIDLEKKQFAYRIWRENLEKSKKHQDDKDSEIKGNWTEIYQMIGFDNVFQGVWFQGVTQLATQRGCRFSVIPIILSVLVSLATIFGVYSKILKVRELEKGLHKDQLCSKALQSFISACEREGVNFDFQKIGDADEESHEHLNIDFGKETEKSKQRSIYLLGLLSIASILFAWLIYLIMCGKYV